MTPAELNTLIEIAHEAAKLVHEVYLTPFVVDYKAPFDPVTEADRRANLQICNRLAQAFPGVPVVAEESEPSSFANYQSAPRIFFVDPLDGTREFVAKVPEFVVMIGLVEHTFASVGVICAPELGLTWVGERGRGAFMLDAQGQRSAIHVTPMSDLDAASIVSSRAHRTPALERALQKLQVRETRMVGSAGLKGAEVARGRADAYVAPHYAGKRWDACAVDALVSAAGGRVSDAQGHPIDYRSASLENSQGILASNGLVHAEIVKRLALP